MRPNLDKFRGVRSEFQFTHPVWGATLLGRIRHSKSTCFNSRTPCGVRRGGSTGYGGGAEFQFTHPVWGATYADELPESLDEFQFTHPVWGATALGARLCDTSEVSIHAPRVGCDASATTSNHLSVRFQFTHPVWGATKSGVNDVTKQNKFQFTHPVWGATGKYCASASKGVVSIHAPRVGWDVAKQSPLSLDPCFNSRTPCGVRQPQ